MSIREEMHQSVFGFYTRYCATVQGKNIAMTRSQELERHTCIKRDSDTVQRYPLVQLTNILSKGGSKYAVSHIHDLDDNHVYHRLIGQWSREPWNISLSKYYFLPNCCNNTRIYAIYYLNVVIKGAPTDVFASPEEGFPTLGMVVAYNSPHNSDIPEWAVKASVNPCILGVNLPQSHESAGHPKVLFHLPSNTIPIFTQEKQFHGEQTFI